MCGHLSPHTHHICMAEVLAMQGCPRPLYYEFGAIWIGQINRTFELGFQALVKWQMLKSLQ